jgi:serine/threonine protein kinase
MLAYIHRYLPPELCESGTFVRQTDIWSVGCTLLEMLTAHEAKELKIAQEARRSENKGAYTNSERLPARKSKKRTGGERGPSLGGGDGEVGEEREGKVGEKIEGEVGGQREGGRHQESTNVVRRSREKGKECPEEGHATATEEVEEVKELGHSPPTGEGGAAHTNVHLNGHALRYHDPPIPDALPAKTKEFVRACLQPDARKRPSAIKLLEHPFLQVRACGV